MRVFFFHGWNEKAGRYEDYYDRGRERGRGMGIYEMKMEE